MLVTLPVSFAIQPDSDLLSLGLDNANLKYLEVDEATKMFTCITTQNRSLQKLLKLPK